MIKAIRAMPRLALAYRKQDVVENLTEQSGRRRHQGVRAAIEAERGGAEPATDDEVVAL